MFAGPPPDPAAGATSPLAPAEALANNGEGRTIVEPAPTPAPAAAYTACSNHSHLPAIGVCPGCLEAFCVDCLPEREDGLMVCDRCAGIGYRLQAAASASASAAAPAARVAEDAQGDGARPQNDKKKRWPF
jgi:hypothetical protein